MEAGYARSAAAPTRVLATAAHRRRRIHPNWRPGSVWIRQAVCIHQHEGAWNDNTGNGYWGGMQFLPSTWRGVGGRWVVSFAHPGDSHYLFWVPPREQLYRAWRVWLRDGRSWREWGTAGVCGLS